MFSTITDERAEHEPTYQLDKKSSKFWLCSVVESVETAEPKRVDPHSARRQPTATSMSTLKNGTPWGRLPVLTVEAEFSLQTAQHQVIDPLEVSG